MTDRTSLAVRRVGSGVVHATRTRFASVPSEKHGRMVRVLKASRVVTACGAVLESSEERPVLVLRYQARPTCRGCRIATP